MVLVSAGPGNQFNLSPRAAAVLGLPAFRHNAKFPDGVTIYCRERKPKAGNKRVVHVNPVELGVVAALAQSIDVRKAGVLAGSYIDLHARLEYRQRDRISAELRKGVDIAHQDRVRDLGIGRLN